mmetsp:Transcript_72596/g.192851  ORF Transcript_72596/g.192851 Transcript_72596/m.192851 type:complete len:267 (+) Transcript_72596:1194-1994(+)
MSLFPRSKARRQPFASLPQTCGVSLASGRSLALATTKTSKGFSGWPHTLGIVRTSNLNLPCGEKAFCSSAQRCVGPHSSSLCALRCQSMPWMSTPARCTEAGKNWWVSEKTGMLPRPQPSERTSAHSRNSLQLLAAEKYLFLPRITGEKSGSSGAETCGFTSSSLLAASAMGGSGGPCAAPTCGRRFSLPVQPCRSFESAFVPRRGGSAAAAMHWPTRLKCSSATWNLMPLSAGNSVFRTSLALSSMTSPPAPLETRPSTRMLSMS